MRPYVLSNLDVGAYLFHIVGLFAIATACVAAFIRYVLASRSHRRIEGRTRSAIERNEFYLEYQAIVDLNTGQWVGAEALLRWRHPRLGLVRPSTFIGQLERTRAIAPLTEFVLATALAELGSCCFPKDFRIHVNLASKHVEMPCFPDDLAKTLKCAPSRFEVVLELTERGMLSQLPVCRERLISLRRQGVKYAVDDFGTESSNLALLRTFEFDYIKLDKQFMTELPHGGKGLVEGIADLAKKIDARVIAEGIEEAKQRDAVKSTGIRYAQGYLFQRPERIREFDRNYRKLQVDRGFRMSAE
ncbi:EAL domain-containing protein [Paraburkholderia sabiae]|uniref:EAL domain-containing protein n=1 Tax=Paraburkholderia sabiae TaxID=273251 RepID=A0ABU9QS67_9BURK|nr:EAL domain-containing protein [Paraburkholderia sabiae]WJZ79440.1 EAL domain-containing protein [Paraburkholderia sabiae]CAD6562788.1 putative cyclic di-GMP phosphodiesterase PdeN [Paraburkholderia sabiae]